MLKPNQYVLVKEESTMPTRRDKYHCNISNYDSEAITSYHAGFVAEVKLLNGFAIPRATLLYSGC
jgi:hypothetical protein